jgi:hypothetical protein
MCCITVRALRSETHIKRQATRHDWAKQKTCTASQYKVNDQRHILRHRRPGTTVCPAFWTVRTSRVKKGMVRKKLFCIWLTRAAKDLLHRHDKPNEPTNQGVTKRCRLSVLTNSALVYESKCGGCGVSANEYSCAHHVTWSPIKLWRSTSIFNLCDQ